MPQVLFCSMQKSCGGFGQLWLGHGKIWQEYCKCGICRTRRQDLAVLGCSISTVSLRISYPDLLPMWPAFEECEFHPSINIHKTHPGRPTMRHMCLFHPELFLFFQSCLITSYNIILYHIPWMAFSGGKLDSATKRKWTGISTFAAVCFISWPLFVVKECYRVQKLTVEESRSTEIHYAFSNSCRLMPQI